jgi:hypothetical protein
MTKTFTAPFSQTINNSNCVITTAGTNNTDSPTNSVLLYTAGPEGSLLTTIQALYRGTNVATSLYLFVSTDGGVTQRLIDSVAAIAYTYSTTTVNPLVTFPTATEDYPLRLAPNAKLYVNTAVTVASGFVVTAHGVDY